MFRHFVPGKQIIRSGVGAGAFLTLTRVMA
jgi:hypothetical protein